MHIKFLEGAVYEMEIGGLVLTKKRSDLLRKTLAILNCVVAAAVIFSFEVLEGLSSASFPKSEVVAIRLYLLSCLGVHIIAILAAGGIIFCYKDEQFSICCVFLLFLW